jgi:chromosome segregation protein
MEFISLELQGFKSFMDRVRFDFQPGITAIVGPNGCGKSNIMDALRWVLGEQSAKNLRGERMEDVIFNGTDRQKPLGMAEVCLRLRTNGTLATDYEEIAITRRLFRSGESEYYLNKSQCRLKDISDLFLDTGVGYSAYSMVGQGKVDFLLSSKPAERRILIEEAAGIMKYKKRKKEALNKLELAQQNLLRVTDIVAELKRQMERLNKQAKAAQRYKKLLVQERELSLKLAGNEYIQLQQSWQEVDAQHQSLQEQDAAQAAQVSGLEARLEELRLIITRQQEELTALQQRVHEQELSASRSEDRINYLNETIAGLEEQQHLARTEIEHMTQEQQALKQQLDDQQTRLGTYEQEYQAKQVQLQQQEESLRQRELRHTQHQQQLDKEKTGVIELAARRAQLNNTQHSLEARGEEIIRKQDKLGVEQQQLEAEIEHVQHRISTLNTQLGHTQKQLNQLLKQRQALKTDMEKNAQLLKQEEEELARLREELGLKSSQLHSLRELNQNLEGFEAGVRTLMQAKDSPEVGLDGIHQVIGRLIKTKSQYESAIEAAMSHRLGYIVVDDFSQAAKAIEYLKQQGKGRVSFILRNRVTGRQLTTQGLEGQPGIIGPAVDLVSCADDYKALVNSILGNVLLVEDLGVAQRLLSQGIGDWTIATLSGEVLESGGVLSGGGAAAGGIGILARNRRIEELQAEVNSLEHRHQKLAASVENRLRHISRLSKSQDDQQRKLRNAELALVNQKMDSDQQQRELERLQNQLQTIDTEQTQLEMEQEEIQTELTNLQAQLRQLEDEEQQKQAATDRLRQQLEHTDQELRFLRQEVNQHRVNLASLEEKRKGTNLDIDRITSAMNNLNQRLSDRQAQLEKNNQRRQELAAEVARVKNSLAELAVQNEELKQTWSQQNRAYQEQAEQLTRTEQQYKQQQRELKELQQQLAQVGLTATKAHLRLSQLAEQITTQFGFPLEQALKQIKQVEGDPPQWSKQLAKVQARLKSTGDVNLTAIEEYNLLQERYEFLNNQKEDLIQSIDSLHKVIARINSTTRERFKKTFEATNEKFGQVYERLFEGGKAELRLEEGLSLLEAGVEIFVQPPGKKLQNLNLLSGGEKALTAIAFLFAIYLIKPSPICFLDEVDAALDDANIGRLVKMLQEFTRHSQFVVITHNKKTMEVADMLYGITMETQGISKIVSAKFNNTEN